MRAGALRYLLRIYEQQRDWEQAIVVHQRLVAIASPEHPTAIAHYHCELAERARRADCARYEPGLRDRGGGSAAPAPAAERPSAAGGRRTRGRGVRTRHVPGRAPPAGPQSSGRGTFSTLPSGDRG